MTHGLLIDKLGAYHKAFATTKDDHVFFDIDKNGKNVYAHRFETIEQFYNGFSLVSSDGNKMLVEENGSWLISEGLEHSNLKTTQIHLDSLNDDAIHDANARNVG